MNATIWLHTLQKIYKMRVYHILNVSVRLNACMYVHMYICNGNDCFTLIQNELFIICINKSTHTFICME